RRAKPRDAAAFDTPVLGRELETEIVDPIVDASSISSLNPRPDFDIALDDELTRAEEAVRRFTGEVQPAPVELHDEPGLLPGFADAVSVRGAEGEFGDGEAEPAASPAAPLSERPYRLPAASVLAAATPPKARTAVNDEMSAAITSVLTQFSVDAK